MNPFIHLFKSYGRISGPAEAELSSRMSFSKKKKGDLFLRAGQRSSGLMVMEKGLVRAFFLKDGKEINTWFGSEHEIIGSIKPLYAQQSSFEYIQFLEDSLLYTLSAYDLDKLYILYPELNLIGRKIAEELCKILEDRIISLHTLSAEERYKALIDRTPDILKRVSLGHIASYLGVTQETLSRIRARI